MAAQPMDALSSFVYLIDNIPPWISQIEALTSHTIQKHDEFIAEYNSLLKEIKPSKKRLRSLSSRSIHSNKADADQLQVTSKELLVKSHIATPKSPDQHITNIVDPEIVNILLQPPRKRNPESLIRSGASGPPKYRIQRQIIIHYDAHVQNELEALVKTIGIARNNLRKGKNALTAAKGFKLPPLGKRLSLNNTAPSPEHYRNHSSLQTAPITVKGRYVMAPAQRQSIHEDELAFMQTDKVLETVQGLCETAAHQFLRDGDCKSELESTVAHLKQVLEEAKVIEGTLRKNAEAEKELDATQLDVENARTADLANGISPSNLELLEKSGTLDDTTMNADLGIKVAAPIMISVQDISSLPTACVEIEVDDQSDDSDLEVDITNFRIANARRITAY